eukprot:scaffold5833_cov165-Amphora_coffeaeformis.AAC.3
MTVTSIGALSNRHYTAESFAFGRKCERKFATTRKNCTHCHHVSGILVLLSLVRRSKWRGGLSMGETKKPYVQSRRHTKWGFRPQNEEGYGMVPDHTAWRPSSSTMLRGINQQAIAALIENLWYKFL